MKKKTARKIKGWPNYKRIDVIKPTNTDWAPSYEALYLGKLVKVSLMTDMVSGGYIWHRVCVWGADDFGMEKYFGWHDGSTPDASRSKAVDCFMAVISMESVNPADLRALGFVNA